MVMVFGSGRKGELIQQWLGKLSFAYKILELSSYKNYNNDNNNIDNNNDNDIQNNNDNNKIASPTRGMHWLTGIFSSGE